MSEVNFEFELKGHGWIDGVFSIGDQRSEVTASYLSDGPFLLLAAVSTLTRTATHARASWEDEPGEYRWLFDRTADRLRVSILEFEDGQDVANEEDGVVRIDADCTLRDLVEAVAAAARAVLDEHGEAGYEKAWSYPFPLTQLALLEGWLDSH